MKSSSFSVTTLLALISVVFMPATAGASALTVYSDFVEHGSLSCGHSHADLQALVSDPSLNQYGNPLVMKQAVVAASQQLSHGCGGGGGNGGAANSTAAGNADHPSVTAGEERSPSGDRKAGATSKPPAALKADGASKGATGSQSGSSSAADDDLMPVKRLALLGLLMLAAAVGAGRWLKRRASRT